VIVELNADLSRPAVVHAASLPWMQSPSAGVERRMLYRVGEEQAIATSIVRYKARSSFPPHSHPKGEEFLVLEGVFEDDCGRYPAGSYVRNPPGSAHAPRSIEGCTIFVRLRQFRDDDRHNVVILPSTSRNRRSVFMPRSLFAGADEHVVIMDFKPHTAIDFAGHGGLELLVLEGHLSSGSECFDPWSWLRLPTDIPLVGVAGGAGCTLWIKTSAPWQADAG
jgi:quercetin dioxygenase-like cupin family protein